MYDPKRLTGPEGACHKQQVREKRCEVCINRRYEGEAFGYPVLVCSIGMRWPKYGYCRGFVLDMSPLDKLTQEAQEMGMYDNPENDE